ncbi:hypothetical protein ABT297_31375 [Dactylosporangium sp. NPDC000555]|uniref:hypothetical protein n=1 Tax=Dactylosporangium sp. NPDC000555 TaxID=3154260 RepID=UPI0033344BA3
MRVSPALRAVAATIALGVCTLLLGLSQAHHAVPGDTFQVVRAAHTTVVPGADTAHGRKHFQPRDGAPSGPRWFAPAASAAGLEPRFAAFAAARSGGGAHAGRAAETTGCRGPPTAS